MKTEIKQIETPAVAVTLDLSINEVVTILEANTGKTIMRISGIAFHAGVNKNGWALTHEGALSSVEQMKGADLTLHHPEAEHGRFKRNMDGGVEEATVGVVTEATLELEENGYTVRYVAEVHRSELFEALESGLWLRPEYGVSIGGTGVPTKVVSHDDGTHEMWFGASFEFDHLAIVHHPAYEKANIETVERVEVESAETIISGADDTTIQSETVSNMTEENDNNEIMAEMEALKAEMVLRDARIAEFEAYEASRAEEKRTSLVSKASELGLNGHDDFSTETLESLIASWEASRPAPVEEPVAEMKPATPASTEAIVASEEPKETMVANYLNGEIEETSESLYERAYNAWASAYNKCVDKNGVQAGKYVDIKNEIHNRW